MSRSSELVSSKKSGYNNQTVIQETLVALSIEIEEINVIKVIQHPGWMTPIIHYLTTYETPLGRGGKEDPKTITKIYTGVRIFL